MVTWKSILASDIDMSGSHIAKIWCFRFKEEIQGPTQLAPITVAGWQAKGQAHTMIVKYQPGERDKPILDTITATIGSSLEDWYGGGSFLETHTPEISSYRNCFILRYPITTGTGEKKTILVKIRRNPKMGTLSKAINADIHGNIPTEFRSLETVFDALQVTDAPFDAVRPLLYMENYHAIMMEEFQSRTLRQILIDQRSSQNNSGLATLRDAATKTGKWLHYFHHEIHRPMIVPYSAIAVFNDIQSYAIQLEEYSRGRISSQYILDAFSKMLDGVALHSIAVSQSHADMTVDNVLYSDDQKICIIDIKTRPAPVYSDVGMILIHPETIKPQILSRGRYLNGSLMREYRAAILSGYFENEPRDDFLVKLFSAIKVLDKWTMYEGLICRYKGWKHTLSFAAGPMVSEYFSSLLKRHLHLLLFLIHSSTYIANLELLE